ncbi:MAG: 1-(5-phosphoribosyl)-5-(5-phosphoribosylamino)methylideneamino imidazole-4-carboxamide isomerase [Gemmatimonadetes bacterium]|nr:1-(5-phosphoribosyl)-5-(5-phosphoribosylamino)methylideneamino imidazole-4-carboxamide isomerase [Gemmatimonadota bacterium]
MQRTAPRCKGRAAVWPNAWAAAAVYFVDMIAIPSVDLRRGICIQPGVPAGSDDPIALGHPIAIARSWANAGFHRLHVLDLDADSGAGSNTSLVEDIVRDGALDVQASGGVQSTDQIERLVDAGATRVVVGPRAIEEPNWLGSVSELFPGMLVVSTDVRERRVVTRGWVRNLPLDIFDVIDEWAGLPLGGVLVASLGVNGHRTPQDLALLEDVAESCEFPVIAAGGVSTMSDLRALEHRGLAAVLLGSVLYSGELDARAVAQEYGG